MKTRTKKEEKLVDFFENEGRTPSFLEPEILSRFISERGKIMPRARTGLSAKNQRKLTREIKRARYLALLPFIAKSE